MFIYPRRPVCWLLKNLSPTFGLPCLFASGKHVEQQTGFRAKREPAFLHPALALYGERNSGQKVNLAA
jgi:hypothetical protein